MYWNRAAEEIHGWREDEVLGRNVVEVTPSDLSRAAANTIMELLRRGRSWSGEFDVRSKNGKRFTVQVSDVPVRDARGDLIGINGVSVPLSYNRTG